MNGFIRHGESPSSSIRLLLALTAMPPERPGRRKLAQLVADHILSHIDLHMLTTIMDEKILPNKLGHDRARSRPSFF